MEPQSNAASSHGQQQQHPVYNIENVGHYGASAAVAAQGYGPAPELYTGAWANVNQGLHGTYREILATYWQQIIRHLENDSHDYKLHHLPLARIKKVMKADPDVKMISAEAPILFAKGCDIFITELTMRAWIHAEENKRRTLQRSDIASALAKSDMFDFLIDIVPREEAASHTKRTNPPGGSAGTIQGSTGSNTSGAPIPSQQSGVAQQAPQQQQQQAQHGMGPPDYAGLANHPMNPESDYRTQPGMYTGAVQSGAPGGYGQPGQPIYGEMDGMYGYTPISQQQQMYHVAQRGQDPSVGQDPGHTYPRHDGGEGDVDADGERDYEVG